MSKIKIEYTSNPAIIKFISDKMLTESSYEYNSIDDAKNSALVQQLFQANGHGDTQLPRRA